MADPRHNRPAHLQLLAISWNFGWPVAAGVVIGHWIDGRLGSSPVAVLVFGLGAMAIGIWNMNKLGRRDPAEIEQEEELRAGDGDGSRGSHGREDPVASGPGADGEDRG